MTILYFHTAYCNTVMWPSQADKKMSNVTSNNIIHSMQAPSAVIAPEKVRSVLCWICYPTCECFDKMTLKYMIIINALSTLIFR